MKINLGYPSAPWHNRNLDSDDVSNAPLPKTDIAPPRRWRWSRRDAGIRNATLSLLFAMSGDRQRGSSCFSHCCLLFSCTYLISPFWSMKKWRAAESCPVCGKRWVPINERLRQFHSIIIKFPPKKKFLMLLIISLLLRIIKTIYYLNHSKLLAWGKEN